MFKMDLKKFKKISSDKNKTMMQHPDGHMITIAHSALSPKVRGELHALPFADGGKVPHNYDELANAVTSENAKQSKKESDDVQAKKMEQVDPPGKFDNGGEASNNDSKKSAEVPEPNKKNAKDMQKGASTPISANEAWGNLKSGLGFADGGVFPDDGQQMSSSMPPANAKDDLRDLPKMTPGQELVQDKMDYLKQLQPQAYMSNPQKLEEDAKNQVLQDQMAAKSSKDIQAQAGQQALSDKVKEVQAYNQNAAQFGLPSKELPPEAVQSSFQQASVQQPQFGEQDRQLASDSQQQSSSGAPDQTISPMAGVQQQMQGIKAEASAMGNLGREQAQIHEQQAQNNQANLDNFQESIDALNKERLAHIEDIKNSHVDPEKYWDNHSKLAAGIGMILAGISPAGGPNQAVGFLNNQINRSIDAQAKNLDSKQNLLRANLEQFHNVRDAVSMTRVMMNDVAAHQLDKVASQSQDPLAKARAMQQIGQLQQQSYGMMQNIAINQAMIKASQAQAQGGGMGQIESMLPYLRQMAPDKAKEIETRLVPGVGLAQVPVTGEVRANLIAKQQLSDRAKDLYNWASQHSGSVDPSVTKVGATKAAELQSLYRNAINGGVFKKGEQEFIDQIVDSDPSKFFNNIRVLPKLKEVINSNDAQLNTLKKGYGLPESKTAAEPMIKTMNGVKYQQVQGGWKKVQ